MRNHNPDYRVLCCEAIEVVLSSEKVHKKFCTYERLKWIREFGEGQRRNKDIGRLLLSLTRKEDPRVRDAAVRGVCTKEAFPKCEDDCECDKGLYCSKCCVQQKVFRCLTCDKVKIKFYCETCWRKDHKGHECEEFFFSARCDSK